MRDAASPLLVPLVGGDWGDAAQAAGARGLVAVLSLATFLWSLPELGAGRGPWAAVLDRTGQDVRADPRRLARHRDPSSSGVLLTTSSTGASSPTTASASACPALADVVLVSASVAAAVSASVAVTASGRAAKATFTTTCAAASVMNGNMPASAAPTAPCQLCGPASQACAALIADETW